MNFRGRVCCIVMCGMASNVSFAAGGGAHVCHEALSRWA